jgi:DNA-directed RNA polymerase subunit L
MSSKELFIKANEIMVEQLELIKTSLVNISNKHDSIISIEREQENIFTLLIHGNDDTIGSVLQYDISKNIDADTDVMVCGYKRVHPLDKIIMFSLSLKGDKTNEQNIMKIIEVFTESSNNLIEIYTKIIEEAKKNL